MFAQRGRSGDALVGRDVAGPIFWALYFLFFLPAGVAQVLDKGLGTRLAPGGRSTRVVEAVLRMYYRTTGPFGRISDAITTTLATNLPPWRATAGLNLAFVVLIGIFLVRDVLVRTDLLRFDGYAWVPDGSGPDVLLAAHYEDRRSESLRGMETPTIQSAVVADDWIRLFLPVSAAVLDRVVRGSCPDVEPLNPGGLRLLQRRGPGEAAEERTATREVIRCLEGVVQVGLDGGLVALELVFHRDPASGRRGVLAFLPTRDLAPGRHTLTVQPLPAQDPDDRRPAWVIPFWI